MAKKQRFADKASKRTTVVNCPVCSTQVSFIKYVKAQRSENGWRFVTSNVGVCKCNHNEIYG